MFFVAGAGVGAGSGKKIPAAGAAPKQDGSEARPFREPD